MESLPAHPKAGVMRRLLDTRWAPHARGGAPMEAFPEATRLVVSTLGQLVCSEALPDDLCEVLFRYLVFSIEPDPLLSQLGLLPPWLARHSIKFHRPHIPDAGLRYVSRVFDETLRLHPPSPGVSRFAVQDDTLGGYHVPAGTEVVASTYVMHRHPKYWKDPEVFDPGRFAPEQAQERPRYVYLPFGGGQRVCIGAMLASLLATVSTSLIAQRSRLEPVPGRKMKPLTAGAHFPENLWLKVSPVHPRAWSSEPYAAVG